MGFGTPPTTPLTAKEVWEYTERDLTRTQYPFWSEIISPTTTYQNVPAGTTVTVSIQPPSGETWWIFLDFTIETGVQYSRVSYFHYNLWDHLAFETGGTYGNVIPGLHLSEIITNSLYAQLRYYNAGAGLANSYYAYSGFKLSCPQWKPKYVTPQPLHVPFKRPIPIDRKIPPPYDQLKKHVFLDEKNDLSIMLEEDTVVAIDPATEFPVSRFSVYCKLETLQNQLQNFKARPVETGWKRYFDRWKEEGIKI